MTTAPPRPETPTRGAEKPDSRGRTPRLAGGLALARNTWRGLTSMRTALVLLFLLAVAALPGALLPQRSLNERLVVEYFGDHPRLAPVLDAVGLFDVFAAPWFAAVYLLLMVSLVGCLGPRTVEHIRGLGQPPVATPRNLARLPHHARATVDTGADELAAQVRTTLRGWRTSEHTEHTEHTERAEVAATTFSAERGHSREIGNLVFHVSLLGLLVAFAAGTLFGYSGQVIVRSGDEFCNTSILGYDSFRAGLRVDGTGLDPFCVRVERFAADYLPTGQAAAFRADLGYQTADDLAAGVAGWRPYPLEVNSPLRLDGERVYLLGHGYAPRFTVTWPDGAQRTGEIQWRPVEVATLLSEGATKFTRPGLTDDEQRRTTQLAVTGLFAPTSSGGKLVTSVFPELRNPEVAVDVLRGDLGLDDGRGQSIFSVDAAQVESGALVRVARANLRPGQEVRLDDGTTVRFDGVRDWVSLQVSHDPGQLAVLVFAVAALGGLAVSLAVRRRRFWVRLTPAGPGRTDVEIGGLARTDRAGYGEEFDHLARRLLGPKEGT
ncbi:MAG: cytochrome c biogenesis protein ResB [Pseudonocardia sp.]